ncbi:MAG: hypothetical protein CVT49_01340 [candidate division Zixibacteria bacterium HGW-Zixibacteria-1]|nr:MAG: hypothetical protein CVT49_01340 [candidate division Zixibacteria bacterium HGW-Zixibacteria-1]
MVVRKRLKLYGNVLVFVTTTVHEWTPIFRKEEPALLIIRQLKETLDYFDVSLVGYVLMPSHLHMLLGFKRVELLSKFMQSFKILSSKLIKETAPAVISRQLSNKNRFRLWRPRFDDLIITSEEQLRIKLNYIHYNPVKSGLVEKPEDWRYSSACDWISGIPGLLPIDKDFAWTD